MTPKQKKRDAHTARMLAARQGKLRRAAKAQVFVTPPDFVDRPDSELPRFTVAEAFEAVQAAHATPQKNLAVAQSIADRQFVQSVMQALNALVCVQMGFPTQAAYFLRCAERLASNSVNLPQTGWPATDGFMAWVNERQQARGFTP